MNFLVLKLAFSRGKKKERIFLGLRIFFSKGASPRKKLSIFAKRLKACREILRIFWESGNLDVMKQTPINRHRLGCYFDVSQTPRGNKLLIKVSRAFTLNQAEVLSFPSEKSFLLLSLATFLPMTTRHEPF